MERETEFFKGRIALDGVERGARSLNKHQRLAHGLFTGREIGEQGIAAAGAVVVFDGSAAGPGGAMPGQRIGERGKDFVQRPVEQVDERVGVAEWRGDGFGAQQGLPMGSDHRPSGAEGVHQCFLHGNYYD